jgi:hypothetical protein
VQRCRRRRGHVFWQTRQRNAAARLAGTEWRTHSGTTRIQARHAFSVVVQALVGRLPDALAELSLGSRSWCVAGGIGGSCVRGCLVCSIETGPESQVTARSLKSAAETKVVSRKRPTTGALVRAPGLERIAFSWLFGSLVYMQAVTVAVKTWVLHQTWCCWTRERNS